MTELEAITTSEGAITWARHRLPAKNTLTADDARIIEDAFEAKMIALAADQEQATGHGAPVTDKSDDRRSEATGIPPNPSRQGPDVPATDGTVVLKPHRLRDKRHREFVAAQPCLVCRRNPSDAHHLRFAQPRALGRKVSVEGGTGRQGLAEGNFLLLGWRDRTTLSSKLLESSLKLYPCRGWRSDTTSAKPKPQAHRHFRRIHPGRKHECADCNRDHERSMP